MKTQAFKSLGLVVNLSVPATVKEFDENAKREGACLDESINNVVYRGSLAEFRDVFIHGQEADKEKGIVAVKGTEDLFKFPRKTADTGRKDEKQNPILRFDETEGDYVDRLRAYLVKQGQTEEQVQATLQKQADTVAATLVFDASARERKPAQPKKLANKYRDTALAIIKGPHLKRFLADIKKALNKDWTATNDANKDAESLGWLVKEFADYKEKQTLASMVG